MDTPKWKRIISFTQMYKAIEEYGVVHVRRMLHFQARNISPRKGKL